MSGETTKPTADGRTGSGGSGVTGHASESHEGHASVAVYVWIGVILAVVTFVEVAVFYIEALDAIEVPLLILLSTAKVVLVIMFFMHLKMDHRALTGLFMTGVVLAVFMVSALVVLYHLLPALESWP
jgi:cytochrome c oxidase subunit IV